MPCSQCAAELVGDPKFCTSCGAQVVPARAVDPFAMTAKPVVPPREIPKPTPSSPTVEPGSSPNPSSRVSPLASSSIEFSQAVRELVLDESISGRASGTVQMQQREPVAVAPAKPASVVPPSLGVAGASVGPGSAVLVRWANGQKYPGTAWQLHGTQVLVSFPDGQRHWVEASFVERA